MTAKKTKRPDWKAKYEEEVKRGAGKDQIYDQRMTAAVNSNNQAVADLQELVKLRSEMAVATTRFEQALAAIEKKLREVRGPMTGLSAWLPR